MTSCSSEFARHEAAVENGPYVRYRAVLGQSLRGICADLGIEPTDAEVATFGGSVGDWPAFPDTADALQRLKERFKLGVITNCDDDLFAASNRRLGLTFDWVVTAEQVGSYKPDPRNFEFAVKRIQVPRERILHVAQSLYHDHVTAQAFGLSTAWIDRRHDKPGFGATPPAEATPDVIAPSMAAFADLALGLDAPPRVAGRTRPWACGAESPSRRERDHAVEQDAGRPCDARCQNGRGDQECGPDVAVATAGIAPASSAMVSAVALNAPPAVAPNRIRSADVVHVPVAIDANGLEKSVPAGARNASSRPFEPVPRRWWSPIRYTVPTVRTAESAPIVVDELRSRRRPVGSSCRLPTVVP